jgi:hypothetical protein
MTKLCACVIAIFVLPPAVAFAQSTQFQTLPEVDAYWKLNQDWRLGAITSRTRDTDDYNSTSIGPTLNYFVDPRPPVTSVAKIFGNQVMFGVGYRGIVPSDENRIELDVTPRYLLPARLVFEDRSRIDLRFLPSSFDWRYRNRPTLSRALKIRRLRIAPYAEMEAYYDIPSSSWNKFTYTGGATIDLGKRFDIQPYYERQHNLHSKTANINAFGLTLQMFFRGRAGESDSSAETQHASTASE